MGSLRTFHLFFITLSVALALFVAVWAGQQGLDAAHVATAIASIAAAGGLTMYGARFQRKTKFM
jgi:hypothetical protein